MSVNRNGKAEQYQQSFRSGQQFLCRQRQNMDIDYRATDPNSFRYFTKIETIKTDDGPVVNEELRSSTTGSRGCSDLKVHGCGCLVLIYWIISVVAGS